MIAAAVAVVALIAVIFVREVPLRTTVELIKPPVAKDGTAPPPIAEPGAATAPVPVSAVAAVPEAAVPEAGPAETDGRPAFQAEALDDPAERISVAALDVLAAAQARARDQAHASDEAVDKVRTALDELEGRINTAIGHFHEALSAVRDSLAEPSEAASLGRDGAGGSELRSYEYGLLVNSQRTADRVTTQASEEADRMLTDARTELAELEAPDRAATHGRGEAPRRRRRTPPHPKLTCQN